MGCQVHFYHPGAADHLNFFHTLSLHGGLDERVEFHTIYNTHTHAHTYTAHPAPTQRRIHPHTTCTVVLWSHNMHPTPEWGRAFHLHDDVNWPCLVHRGTRARSICASRFKFILLTHALASSHHSG